MKDWNGVATVREEGYVEARRLLEELAPVAKTDYFNVLVLRVPDARQFAEELATVWQSNPDLKEVLGRVTPLERLFDFQSPSEFETRAKEAVEPWLDRLAGTRFHVRMHRRGFRQRLSSQAEERFLDQWIQTAAAEIGREAQVTFQEPDFILDLETVGQRGGLALWDREDLARYPFLHLD